MSPVSFPAAIVRKVIPEFNGPTAWLLSRVRTCARNQHSEMQQVVGARVCCIAAVATAALEMVVHVTLFAATIPMIAAKRCIWMTLIGCSAILGGLFGLIHGDAFKLGWEVWLKRIAIHMGLFLRHPSVVWDHLMVWRGLMWEHSVLIVQITSLALSIERHLSRVFSSHHLEHHALQAFRLLRFIFEGIPSGLWNPEITAKQAIEQGLGPTKPRALIVRLWRCIPSPYPIIGKVLAKTLVFIGAHWDKLGVLLIAYAAYKDSSAFLSLPGYLSNLPVRVLDGTLDGLEKVASAVWRIISPAHLTPEQMERLIEAVEKSNRWFK